MPESDQSDSVPVDAVEPLRIDIDRVVQRAEELAAEIDETMPRHPGLRRAGRGIVRASKEARAVSQKLGRTWGPHRLPVVFVVVALTGLVIWSYWQFLYVSKMTVGVPDRDAIHLHKWLGKRGRVEFIEVDTEGSRDGVTRVANGEIDIAFVQGGIPIPDGLPRLKADSPELIMFFVKQGIEPHDIKTVLTSIPDQGSHSVAQSFLKTWGIEHRIEYVHKWNDIVTDGGYVVPSEVDAVFVVKDPASEKALTGALRLHKQHFFLTSPILGARESQLDFIRPATLEAGYLNFDPPVPGKPISTYAVSTFLVAREGLTPRDLAAATHLLDSTQNSMAEDSFELTADEASELLQGVDAFLGILITIGLAFIALLGIDAFTYRKRFNELNSLISLISMHQSTKDVIGLEPEPRSHNVKYLRLCGDLLGLISVLTGYYAQENSSLLYNNLLSMIPERCNSLKLNIQLKILHANIELNAEHAKAPTTLEAPQVRESLEDVPPSS